MKCTTCQTSLGTNARFCSGCGMQVHENVPAHQDVKVPPGASVSFEETFESWMSKNSRKVWWAAGAVTVLLVIGGLISSSGGGSNYDSNGITVEQFGCSFGTEVASAIVKNNTNEAKNAFVTVGLYGTEGTLQWSGTEWGMVEAGGKRLINVRLGGYMFIRGDCKIINVGY